MLATQYCGVRCDETMLLAASVKRLAANCQYWKPGAQNRAMPPSSRIHVTRPSPSPSRVVDEALPFVSSAYTPL